MNVELECMAIEMPLVEAHPNRRAFRGILTRVDVLSDRPPSGARGRRVVLTAKAAEAALPSLLGMALDFEPRLEGHDARTKVGIITAADLVDTRDTAKGRSGAGRGLGLAVEGYLFAKDFPEIVREIGEQKQELLGMSYEIADVRVADVNAETWVITECKFTGAAVLKRAKAAYRDTSIQLTQ